MNQKCRIFAVVFAFIFLTSQMPVWADNNSDKEHAQTLLLDVVKRIATSDLRDTDNIGKILGVHAEKTHDKHTNTEGRMNVELQPAPPNLPKISGYSITESGGQIIFGGSRYCIDEKALTSYFGVPSSKIITTPDLGSFAGPAPQDIVYEISRSDGHKTHLRSLLFPENNTQRLCASVLQIIQN